jgi:5,5'-dehydrodivanillate O-demethylase
MRPRRGGPDGKEVSMLTMEQNDRLTLVGPGTPMGDLLRRYWHPIAPSDELNDENPTKEVRLLGEDLVLFRSTVGKIGLIEPSCPHRKANLSYGVPEPEGIRCAYHGWLFDENGLCIDQPSEPNGSKFKGKVKLKSYPAEELGGLIFAYMGPQPSPLLPRWDLLTWTGVHRTVDMHHVPANWLQCMENSLDPVHFEWLHRNFGGFTAKRLGKEQAAWLKDTAERGLHHERIGFNRFEYGIIKRRIITGETESSEWWRVGHPVLFPNVLREGTGRRHGFQYRVPVDDTHTLHLHVQTYLPEPGQDVPETSTLEWQYKPVYDDNGRVIAEGIIQQDILAWTIQGPIMDRMHETLGVTDIGVIMYRKLLNEQLDIVADGGDPMNVHRDPALNDCIYLPQEVSLYPGDTEIGQRWKDVPVEQPEVEALLD